MEAITRPAAIPQGRRNLAAVARHADDLVRIDDAVSALGVTRPAATKLLWRWARQGWLRRVGPGTYAVAQLDSIDSDQVLDDPWVLVPTLYPPPTSATLGRRQPRSDERLTAEWAPASGKGSAVTARIERDKAGGWSINVRPHSQTPADMAELAERVEALLAAQTAPAAGVRLGRRLVTLLTAEEANNADQAWLEGFLLAAAHASGLDWDRWRCMAVAQALRDQRGGWEHAVVRAIGGREASPAGAPSTH